MRIILAFSCILALNTNQTELTDHDKSTDTPITRTHDLKNFNDSR